ncbi:MAG: O-antigen ligase family protein [Clostridia bacterium]|nr:O-antigen ligase family protein [Clostridia bacterium]
MKNNVLSKQQKTVGLDFILMSLLMFVTDSPLFIYTTNPLLSSFRKWFVILVPCFLLARLMFQNIKFSKMHILVVLILSANLLLTAAVTEGESFNVYVLYGFKILTAALITVQWSFERFVQSFIRVMRVIAICSLIIYIFVQIDSGFAELLPIVEIYESNGNGTMKMGTAVFSNVYLNVSSSWTMRNFGAFWEPGAYAAYLNLALFFILFHIEKNKIRVIDIVLFAASLVTTVSLGGIIAGGILILMWIFNIKKTKGGLAFFVILVFVAAALYISSNEDIMEMFTHRLQEDNGSFDSRWYSIFGNLRAFAERPLVGVGLQTVDERIGEYYAYIGRNIHNTNTLLLYFSSLGIIAGSTFTYMWWKVATKSTENIFYQLAMFVYFFIMLANEDFTGSYTFMLVPLYVMTLKDEHKSKEVIADAEDSVDKQLPLAYNKQGFRLPNRSK